MKISNILLWVAVAVLSGWLVFSSVQTNQSFGGVGVGSEYNATSTVHGAIVTTQLIRQGQGTLGSVVINGVGTSGFTLYDATSTDFSTNPQTATSTSRLAVIPASSAAGTYVFDVTYTKGLLVYYDVLGTHVTSTITYR